MCVNRVSGKRRILPGLGGITVATRKIMPRLLTHGELLLQLELRGWQVQQFCNLTAVSVCLACTVNQVGQPIGWDVM